MTALALPPPSDISAFRPVGSHSTDSLKLRPSNDFPIQDDTLHHNGITKRALESESFEGSLTKDLMSKHLKFGEFGTKHGMTLSPTTKEVQAGPLSPRIGFVQPIYRILHHPSKPVASSSKFPSKGTPSSSRTSSDSLQEISTSITGSHQAGIPSRKGKEIAHTSRASSAALPTIDAGLGRSLFHGEVSVTWPETLAYKRHGAGLRNPSMACYANASLQVILHTPPFLRIALDHREADCTLLITKGFCALCTLSKMTQEHWITGQRWYAPDIHRFLGRIKKGFNKNKQEDTHEFFRFVTDALQSSALAGHPKDLSEKIKHTTWVYRIWGGKVRSRVLCDRCRKPSDTYDHFLDLSLDVNMSGPKSVLNMLKGFVKEDRLDGVNKYHCETCKSKTTATKGLKIAHAPPVLTLHLKRFSVNFNTYSGAPRASKNNSVIDFEEYLDISKFTVDPTQPGTKYRLFGVTCHSGSSPTYGHYISFVRSPRGTWYRADDEDVEAVPISKVTSDRTAYLLSYLRVDSDRESATAPLEIFTGHRLQNGTGGKMKSSDDEGEKGDQAKKLSYPLGCTKKNEDPVSEAIVESKAKISSSLEKINVLQPTRIVASREEGIDQSNVHSIGDDASANSANAHGHPVDGALREKFSSVFGPLPSTEESLFPSNLHSSSGSARNELVETGIEMSRATAGIEQTRLMDGIEQGLESGHEEDDLDDRQSVSPTRQARIALGFGQASPKGQARTVSSSKFYGSPEGVLGMSKKQRQKERKRKAKMKKVSGAPMPFDVGRMAAAGVHLKPRGIIGRMQGKTGQTVGKL